MIRFGTCAALALSALLCSTPALAQDGAPFLWKIEGETPSYLFGTFSPAFESTSKLHPAVKTHLAAMDEVLDESEQNQEAVQKFLYLEQGKSIKDVLPEDVYAAVEARLKKRGVPAAALARYRPWVVAIQLQQLEFMPELQRGVGQSGPLQQLLDKKPRTGLMSFEEAAGAFADAPMDDQVQIVRDILGKLEAAEAEKTKVNATWAEAYAAGDVEAAHTAWVEDMTGQSEELNARLIKAMYDDYVGGLAKRIAEKVKAGDKGYAVLVSNHLVGGEQSLIKALEAEGLTLTRVSE